MQKAQGEMQQALGSANSIGPDSGRENDLGTAIIHEDGTVVRPSMDDKASTRALRSPMSTPKVDEHSDNGEVSIPSIRISTESSRAKDGESEVTKVEEEEEKAASAKRKGKAKATEEDEDEDDKDDVEDEDEDEAVEKKVVNGNTQTNGVKSHAPEKPAQAAGEGEQAMNEASPTPAQEPFSFSTKRLCERWLDNLFMVLYEVCYSRSIHNLVGIDIVCFSTSRIYASGQFSVPRSRISKLNMSPTAKLGMNGKSSVISAFVFTIKKRPKRHTSGVSTAHDILQNHGRS